MSEARGTGASDGVLIVRINRFGKVVAHIQQGNSNAALSFPVDGWQVIVEQHGTNTEDTIATKVSGAVIAEAADVAALSKLVRVLDAYSVVRGEIPPDDDRFLYQALLRETSLDDLARLAALIERAKGGG